MRTATTLRLVGVLLGVATSSATWAQPQIVAPNLVFNSVRPCRLVDTRIHSTPLVPGTPQTFNVVGTGDLSGQGGSPTGCAIPGFDVAVLPQVQAVMVNVVAVGASGPGDLVAWPTDQSQPTASSINYAATSSLSGLNIANALILGVRQDTPGNDISVVAQVHGTHLVIDALGFFTAGSPSAANSTSNTFLGFQAGSLANTGLGNVGLGSRALQQGSGTSNTAVGNDALRAGGSLNCTVVGAEAAPVLTGAQNTAVGADSLNKATSGVSNTAVGEAALKNITSGSENIGVGHLAGTNYASSESTNIVIGSGGQVGDNDTIRIGDNGYTAAFIGGISGATSASGISVLVNTSGHLGTTTSSRRFKDEVADMGTASDGLLRLRPVTFRYKPAYDDGNHLLQYGLIAEEVAEVYPALVRYDQKGLPDAVRYQFLNTMLLNELQKQHTTIAEQAGRLARQEDQVTLLAERLAKLEAELAASRTGQKP